MPIHPYSHALRENKGRIYSKFMINYLKYFIFLIFLTAAIFISACVGITKKGYEKSADLPEAENILAGIQNKNNNLKTFKGIGKIRIWNKNLSHTVRVAWLGEEPEKLRIEIMSIAGQPAASVAGNGQSLYFVSHVQQQFYKKEEKDPDLKEILSLPVKFRDIIAILRGCIPIRDFNSLSMEKDNSGDGYVMILKRRWGNIAEKIFTDKSGTKICKIEIFDAEGLSYRVESDNFQDVKGFQIPFNMKFSNDAGEGFQFYIERYWSNIGIAPSKFVLNPIEQ